MSRPTRPFTAAAALLLGLALSAGACGDGDTADRGTGEPDAVPAASDVPSAPYLEPGGRVRRVSVENPHAGDPEAMAQGRRLYAWYNCGGCHGPNGGGAIGPSLRDGTWIYGGDDASVFRSVWDGRPEGMPTWRGKIPEDDVWKIVAFVTSLEDESPVEILPGEGGG